jgi:two-component system, cell cycle sensor histidine kinase and response regulator CckA
MTPGEVGRHAAAIVDALRQPLLVLDAELRVQHANAAFYSAFGVGVAETEQRPFVEIGDRPWDVPGLVERLRAVLARDEEFEGFVVERDVPSGGSRVLSLDARRLATGPEDRPLILLVIEDLTRRRRQDGALCQRQRLEAIGRLAVGVSHDFNNLLTIINARVELLSRRLGPATPHARDLAVIRDTTQRASVLAGQLLLFGGRHPLPLRVVDLDSVVRGLEARLRQTVPENIALVIALHASGRIRGDASLLEQGLVHLVANAREAMPTGGRLVVETLDMELDEAFVREHPGATVGPGVALAVTDTGVGMTAAIRDRLFEPFFTTTSRKGAGLGLAAVYGIVTQCNGSVWVDSAPGAGTTVTMCFPRLTQEAEAEPDHAP